MGREFGWRILNPRKILKSQHPELAQCTHKRTTKISHPESSSCWPQTVFETGDACNSRGRTGWAERSLIGIDAGAMEIGCRGASRRRLENRQRRFSPGTDVLASKACVARPRS